MPPSQVVRYCSKRGIKYAMFSCWWFTWAVELAENDIRVSAPFPWNSMQPTISGVRRSMHLSPTQWFVIDPSD